MAVICSPLAVALGGNLDSSAGTPHSTLRAALQVFPDERLVIRSISQFYGTPCFPFGKGPDYVNAVALCETTLTPQEVLAALHRIEARFGRQRSSRWAGRTLDLDLLYYDQLVLPNAQIHQKWRDLSMIDQESETPDQLLIPHPRLQDRAFVLVPLADVAPDWVHPVSGDTVKTMLNAISTLDRQEVVAL